MNSLSNLLLKLHMSAVTTKMYNSLDIAIFILLQGSTCPFNEYTHFKMAKVSAKGKHDWAFCSDSSYLCLSGWNSTDLAKQVLCLTTAV